MFEFRHLRHFLALVEFRNFARAAESLHITQPALTKSIQSLEESLGVVLVNRGRTGLELTEYGKIVLEHAKNLDIGARELSREVDLTKGLEIGVLNIGVGPYGGSMLVGPAVGRLSMRHPELQIQLIVGPWKELPQRARRREIDLLVGGLGEVETQEGFDVIPLSPHPGYFVCRPEHPLSTRRSITWADLLAYPIAGPEPGRALEESIRKQVQPQRQSVLRKQGLPSIQCDSAPMLIDILKNSNAIALMSGHLIAQAVMGRELHVLSGVALDRHTRYGVAYLSKRALSASADAFVHLLLEYDKETLSLEKELVTYLRKSSRNPRT